MTQDEARAILVAVFRTLTDKEVSNFAYHLKRETPVLVGVWQFEYRGVG